MKHNAKEISKLLSIKHHGDIFIPECKTGASWGSGYTPRLDAWVMRKSYANACTIGYEIKVSKQDFLNDKKWVNYLPFCNEFYFVCPPKLILPSEVPENTGLYWTSINCKKLYIKKKAPYREVNIPESIYMYILMSRAKIYEKEFVFDMAQYWRDWKNEKDENKNLGMFVSKKIAGLVRIRIELVDNENRKMKRLTEQYKEVAEFLTELGYGIGYYDSMFRIKNKIEALIDGIPGKFEDQLVNTRNDIDNLINQIKNEREKNNGKL